MSSRLRMHEDPYLTIGSSRDPVLAAFAGADRSGGGPGDVVDMRRSSSTRSVRSQEGGPLRRTMSSKYTRHQSGADVLQDSLAELQALARAVSQRRSQSQLHSAGSSLAGVAGQSPRGADLEGGDALGMIEVLPDGDVVEVGAGGGGVGAGGPAGGGGDDYEYEYEYYSEDGGSGGGGDEFVIQLPDLHYFRLHVIYFTLISTVGTIVLWGLESGHTGLSFWDALFTSASALTVTGLQVVDFSQFRAVSQVWVLFLIIAGGIIVTTFPSLFLKRQRILVKRFASLHTPGDLRFYDIEYAALGRLLLVIPATVFGILATAFVIMGMYMQFSELGMKVLEGTDVGPWWWSLFHTFSAFNNAGFALLPDNLVSLQGSVVINVVISALIICGNTGFPVVLYSVIWVLHKRSRYGGLYKYLLDNPRWYILLFPGIQTKMFMLFSIGLLLPTSLLFLAVETQRSALSSINGPTWILAAFFQSISTRTAGFNTVDVGAISHAILVLYIVMMYIRPYPVAGIKTTHGADGENRPESDALVDQLQGSLSLTTRSMLIRNSLWLFTVIVLIFIAEGSRLSDPDAEGYDTFRIVFEVFSAFGNVGLSMGFPGAGTSFAGALSTFSQLLIISVMYLGRHRGLAASLHDMEVEEEEREEAKLRRQLQLVHEAKVRFMQKHMLSSKRHHVGGEHRHDPSRFAFHSSLRRHSVE